MNSEAPPTDNDLTTGRDLIHEMLAALALAEARDELPDDSPIARITKEFFANNWAQARDGLLARTKKMEVQPQPSPTPRVFQFRIHTAYKRKDSPHARARLAPGPVRGAIYYRCDLFSPGDDAPSVAVVLHDRMLHPNYSRRHGLLCLGDLPKGNPISLEHLLEHIYRIVTYQNLRVTHPADGEAAEYFATDPDAMSGLAPAEPLF